MDFKSLHMTLSGEFDDVVKNELKDKCLKRKNWNRIFNKFGKKSPGLFKEEFSKKRMVALSSKSYYIEKGEKSSIKDNLIQQCFVKPFFK